MLDSVKRARQLSTLCPAKRQCDASCPGTRWTLRCLKMFRKGMLSCWVASWSVPSTIRRLVATLKFWRRRALLRPSSYTTNCFPLSSQPQYKPYIHISKSRVCGSLFSSESEHTIRFSISRFVQYTSTRLLLNTPPHVAHHASTAEPLKLLQVKGRQRQVQTCRTFLDTSCLDPNAQLDLIGHRSRYHRGAYPASRSTAYPV